MARMGSDSLTSGVCLLLLLATSLTHCVSLHPLDLLCLQVIGGIADQFDAVQGTLDEAIGSRVAEQEERRQVARLLQVSQWRRPAGVRWGCQFFSCARGAS